MNRNLLRRCATLSLVFMLAGTWMGSAQQTKPESSAVLAEEAPTNGVHQAEGGAPSVPHPPAPTHRRVMVLFGEDADLKANETAEVVVVIGGSARVQGKVMGPVVAIGGDVNIDGTVGEAAVAVLGSIRLGPAARVSGDAVSVGGKVAAAEGAKVSGGIQEVGFAGLANFFSGFREWFVQCVLKMRPLAPGITWVWVAVAVAFLVYLMIAAVFRRPVQACVEEIGQRPATTFLLGMLSLVLLPLVLMLLGFTLVGLVVVPFLMAALVIGIVVGKVAIFEWIGQSLGSRVRGGQSIPWLPAFIIGFLIVILFYNVPFLGMVVYAVLTVWALGVATIAVFSSFRQEMPEKPPIPAPLFQPAPMVGPAGATAWGEPAAAGGSSAPPPPIGTPTGAAGSPSLPEGLSQVKASFWERMGAAFLDIILIGIVAHLVHGPPFALLIALAYFAGMWAWKGTTIGGIVLGIKVVRLDGKPVSVLVGIVRGLAAGFSTGVLFLGFLWIAWDRDRQGWHDKIAGTIVVRMPRGTSLLCF